MTRPPTREELAREAFLASAELDGPRTEALVRRVRRSAEAPRRQLDQRWLAVPLLAAAALLLAIPTRPAPEPDPVRVVFEGEGSIEGTETEPHLRWSQGTAHVSVEPNRGVRFTVTTEEATVRVIGTAFDVRREEHATEVVVDHGRVAVTCTGGEERVLTDGERTTCLPRELSALLKRTTALLQRGADPAERLATLEAAASIAPEPGPMDASIRAELLAHRVDALSDAGDAAAALAAAERYLAAGHAPRRPELLGFVARARLDGEGCAEAREALETAVAELPPGPEWTLLATCVADTDPARARALIEAVGGEREP